ncbi:zinc finger protein 184 isoform X3 [Anabrus simplex]
MDDIPAIKCEPEDQMENGEVGGPSIMSTVEEVDIKTEMNEDMLLADVKPEIPVADIEIKDEVLEPSEWCEDEDSCSSSSETLTKCPHCDEKYPDYSQMEYHIAALHPGKKRHLCFECNRSFRRRTDFITHSKTHQNSGGHICPMCLKDLSRSENLQRHISIVHKDIKLLPCAVCKKTFSSPTELQEHIFGHNRDERLYSCDTCGKMFNRHENMLRHMITHSKERPHICPECKKGFKHSGQLKTHLQIHSLDKPKPCFTCKICFQTFTKMGSLRRHLVFHTNETPFLCSECGKAFKQKSSLDYHQKTLHSSERLHLCHQCGMSFVSHSGLNKHVSVHLSGV